MSFGNHLDNIADTIDRALGSNPRSMTRPELEELIQEAAWYGADTERCAAVNHLRAIGMATAAHRLENGYHRDG